MQFHESKITKITVHCSEFGDSERGVCPECINHEQISPLEILYDCKNLFHNDDRTKITGQCCCWSKEHK